MAHTKLLFLKSNIIRSKIKIVNFTIAIILGLSLGFLAGACKKSNNKLPNTGSLVAAIDSAYWYLNHTSYGTQPGEYPTGSKIALQNAFNAAQSVLMSASNNAATQAQVTAAAANLDAAIDTYIGSRINPIAQNALVAYWKFNGNADDSSGMDTMDSRKVAPMAWRLFQEFFQISPPIDLG
jgi:hypothetical protein